MVMLRGIRHCVILSASVQGRKTERPTLNDTHRWVLPVPNADLDRRTIAETMRYSNPPPSTPVIWKQNKQRGHENKFGHNKFDFEPVSIALGSPPLSLSPLGENVSLSL